MPTVTIDTAWIVPSPAFNRLVYRVHESSEEVLEFRAHPGRADAFATYRVPAMEIGPHLMSVIDSLDESIPRDFLYASAGLVLGRRT